MAADSHQGKRSQACYCLRAKGLYAAFSLDQSLGMRVPATASHHPEPPPITADFLLSADRSIGGFSENALPRWSAKIRLVPALRIGSAWCRLRSIGESSTSFGDDSAPPPFLFIARLLLREGRVFPVFF